MLPRFYVNEISGYAIRPDTMSKPNGKERLHIPVCCAVLDRAYCHRIIHEFRATGGAGNRNTSARLRAATLCAELNERYGNE